MRIGNALLVTMLLVLFSGCGTGAATARGETPTPKTGEELLDRVEKTLRDLPAASFDVDGSMTVAMQGIENKMESQLTVRFERPRRWFIDLKSPSMEGQSVSDGKELTTYLAMSKRFTVLPVPEDWDPETASDDAVSIEWRVASIARMMMGHSLKSTVMGMIKSSEVKDDQLDGKPCWVGTFSRGTFSFNIWVSADDRPLVQRIEGSSSVGGGDDANAMKVKMTWQFDVKNFDAEPKFSAKDFAFTPPAGAELAESLMEGMGGMPEIHPLVGELAPEFEIETLAGEPFKLADAMKQKQVVMLDFWATWCGPCVEALPEVAAAAKETRDKGVVFYAVNLQETPEQIQKFLDEQTIEAPVLLDKEGAIAQQYQVSGIPQTVLIGKDGRVHVVHVGFGGDAKATLIKQLTALADGKDLAGETLKKRDDKQDAGASEDKATSAGEGAGEAEQAK